jgi:HSP20 family protein
MANINVRNDGQPTRYALDWPNRRVRSLLSWAPFRELERSFEFEEERSFLPAFDVKETDDAFVFFADVPGIKESDVQIQVHGPRLTISGKRAAEEKKEGEKFVRYERRHGTFTRAFTLPESADTAKVSAAMKDGVLTVTVAKKASDQPRTVAVNAAK